MEQKTLILSPKDGRRLNVLGEKLIIKVDSNETNGVYSVVEETSAPKGGPPPHVHEKEDEMFYILEGEVEVTCGDQTFRATKGAMAVLPRNIPHGFRNIGTSESKVLVTITPGGFEHFFD